MKLCDLRIPAQTRKLNLKGNAIQDDTTTNPASFSATTGCELYSGLINGFQVFNVWATVTRVNGVVSSAVQTLNCIPLTSTTQQCEFLSQGPSLATTYLQGVYAYGYMPGVNFNFVNAGWYDVTRVNGAITFIALTPRCTPVVPLPTAVPVAPAPPAPVVAAPAPQVVVLSAPAPVIRPPSTGDAGLLN